MPDVSTGSWVVLVALVAAVGFGLYRGAVDGRFRGTHAIRVAEPRDALGAERVEATAGDVPTASPSVLAGTPWATDLGQRATLLQFSSAFCAPCRTTRHVLADVASHADGVTHIEVDAEGHLDLVRRLGHPPDAHHSGPGPGRPRAHPRQLVPPAATRSRRRSHPCDAHASQIARQVPTE